MGTANVIIDEVKELLDKERFGVLASYMDAQPYSNLMAFLPCDEHESIIFFTSRTTRKYGNLKKHPQCSMFIDNRRNKACDYMEARGLCICGEATEICPCEETTKLAKLFLKRHPILENFVKVPSTAFFKMKINSYYFVENFQEVTEIHLD